MVGLPVSKRRSILKIGLVVFVTCVRVDARPERRRVVEDERLRGAALSSSMLWRPHG